jgi:hypothetical protein
LNEAITSAADVLDVGRLRLPALSARLVIGGALAVILVLAALLGPLLAPDNPVLVDTS